jgi:hypothetical protein
LKENEQSTVVGKISGLVGLYAIFVFISGWTYLDFYYRTFGVYSRWLDISISETLTKGFLILFEGGQWLWVIYIFVLVVPVLFEVFPRLRSHVVVQLLVACVLLSCLPISYSISRKAGITAALLNQGAATSLADIRFRTDCGLYLGKLVFAKDAAYYVHDATLLREYKNDSACWKPSQSTDQLHTLTIFRADDVHGLEIVEHN